MSGQRLGPRQGIRRGGFSGGTFVAARAPARSNSLLELSDALGTLNQAGQGAIRAYKNREGVEARVAERDVKEQESLLRGEAADEAERIKASLSGYTSEQLGAEFASDEMAAKFKENPYILPALSVHQGRVKADEMAIAMIDAGVDVDDPQQVSEYLQAHSPQDQDEFYSRGFNEQLQRHQSQFTQKALQAKLSEADDMRTEAAGREFLTIYQDTGDVQAAVDALGGAQLGLSGPEQTEVQMNMLRAAAAQGDLELAKAIAGAGRGSAPPLAGDANVIDDVAALVEQAEMRNEQNNRDSYIAKRTEFYDRIESGTTRRSLEEDPEFQALPESYQSQIIERHRSNRAQKRSEAKTQHKAWFRSTARAEAGSMALEKLVSGQGATIDDFEAVDPVTGDTVSVSRNQLVEAGVREFRQRYLGDNPFSLQGADTERYRQYTNRLAKGDLYDPMLKGHMEGLGALLTPEAMLDGAGDVSQGFSIYKSMDPVIARRYVSDTRTRTVFETMDRLQQRNPDAAPEDLAKRAVALVNMDKPPLTDGSKLVREATKGLEIEDPLNDKGKFLFVFGGGSKEESPDSLYAQPWIADRANELYAFNGDVDASLEQARADFAAEHTVVRGRVVQLPNGPSGDALKSRETPESWAEKSEAFFSGLAVLEDRENSEGYSMTLMDGNTYLVTDPDGDVQYFTANQIRRMSQTVQAKEAADKARQEQEEREAAAEKSVRKRRKRSRSSAPTPSGPTSSLLGDLN